MINSVRGSNKIDATYNYSRAYSTLGNIEYEEKVSGVLIGAGSVYKFFKMKGKSNFVINNFLGFHQFSYFL